MANHNSNSTSDNDKNSNENYLPPLQTSAFTIIEMLVHGRLMSQAIYIATKLRIADFLENGVKSIDELAEQTKAHPDSLYRLLRMLASVGIFAERETENNKRKFELTPKASILQSKAKDSMRNFALLFGLESFDRAISGLLYSIETGENSFKHANGFDIFEYFQQKQNREDAQIFNSGMTSITSLLTPSIFSMYDFSQFNTVVDIGGGEGVFLLTILKNNPNLHGILFDLPQAIEGAKRLYINNSANKKDKADNDDDFLSRCELIGGDFFKSIPPGADGYIIKNVILDWDDDSAVVILRNCSQAMKRTKAGGTAKAITRDPRLLIIDTIMPEGNEPFMGKSIDMLMLALTHKGRIRTEGELHKLLNRSGFDISKIIRSAANLNLLSIIEAIPSSSS